MEPADVIILEWTFSPADYFENTINIKRDDYEMLIDHGKVEAKIRPDIYEKNPNLRDDLHRALDDRFLGVQLLSHRLYELSKASMYRLYPNGHKNVTVFVDSLVLTLSVGMPDIIVRDKNGNVVSDSRADRIEEKKKLADLVEKYCQSDLVARSLLNSHKAAVNDPDNELVHLYEIRDALSRKFNGQDAACKILNISSTQWRRLGRLANDEPLKQGRHRGKNPGTLRDATEAELSEARDIARHFVEAYLVYLERRSAKAV